MLKLIIISILSFELIKIILLLVLLFVNIAGELNKQVNQQQDISACKKTEEIMFKKDLKSEKECDKIRIT
jgi:uncharacterized membrane protein